MRICAAYPMAVSVSNLTLSGQKNSQEMVLTNLKGAQFNT